VVNDAQLAKLAALAPIILLATLATRAQDPQPGKNVVTVRGQAQKVYFYPAADTARHRAVLFVPGDRGCEGFAVTISERLAKSGYDTYCFDTRRYLQSFTGRTILTTTEIASDLNQIARWIQAKNYNRVLLVGWSEGAGLGLAAAADGANQKIFEGLLAIGTPEENILAWHWRDIGATLAKTVPHEPTFKSLDFMARVSPLPVFMIASTSNEYVSQKATSELFAAAREPKNLVTVAARDHKYSGNENGFCRALQEGMSWIE
jgi:pimeloyl-ACP methyl ester carboxylesterase